MADDTTPKHPFSVSGKRAIITGGGSGINLALSKLLLSKGCNVVIADLALRPEAKQFVDAHSDASHSPRVVFQKTDVTSWKALEAMFERCITEFGGVDIVGPGAGVFEEPWSSFWLPPGSAESKDMDSYRTLDINLTHPIRVAQMAISHFLNHEKGSVTNPKRIVLTSSIAGQVTPITVPLYTVTKHGISAFARCMAPLEDKVGIRVNAVAPGIVRTPLWEDHPEKMATFDAEKDKWVTPEEVAEAMVRLMEDDELGGGTVLEVGALSTRVVPLFNNPGPKGDGFTTSNIDAAGEYVLDLMQKPGWGQKGVGASAQ